MILQAICKVKISKVEKVIKILMKSVFNKKVVIEGHNNRSLNCLVFFNEGPKILFLLEEDFSYYKS